MKNNCYILFAGYHSVAAASELLARYHIDNSIVRAPVGIGNGCCSFALVIDKCDSEMSGAILENKAIRMVCD